MAEGFPYYPLCTFLKKSSTWGYVYCLETERQREKKHQCERETSTGCLLYASWPRNQTCNLGMCPDWESNPQPFSVWDDIPINWTTQSGHLCTFLISLLGFHCVSSWVQRASHFLLPGPILNPPHLLISEKRLGMYPMQDSLRARPLN